MKFALFAVGAVALALAGCQTTAQQPKKVFVRADGQPILSNPKNMQQAELDKTVCIGETQKAAVGMPPIYYSGIAGAINAGIIEGQRQSALLDVAIGCMASKGYILVPEEEALARRTAYENRNRRRG